MGDEVLKCVAETLLKTARESDIVCRYGGEEFCVLLPHVDAEGAKQAGERFRQAISDLQFDQLSVTASLGCADRTQGAHSAEGMLEQADEALYQAKRGGRNQVVAFSAAGEEEKEARVQGPQEQVAQEPVAVGVEPEEQETDARASTARDVATTSITPPSISPPSISPLLPGITPQVIEPPRSEA